jgi:hypothetical protein
VLKTQLHSLADAGVALSLRVHDALYMGVTAESDTPPLVEWSSQLGAVEIDLQSAGVSLPEASTVSVSE